MSLGVTSQFFFAVENHFTVVYMIASLLAGVFNRVVTATNAPLCTIAC